MDALSLTGIQSSTEDRCRPLQFGEFFRQPPLAGVRFSYFVALMVTATLLPGIACAAAINVSINTSTLSGISANLAFDLTDGDSVVSNNGTLTNFLTDGTVGTPTVTGGVTGTLPGPVTIADSSFFNELLIPLVLGNSITFTIDFTHNFVGSVPDNLSFFLLDATATNSLVATNLLGDALVSVDMNANPGGLVLSASSTNPSVPVLAVPISTGTVPEPLSFLLRGLRAGGDQLRRSIHSTPSTKRLLTSTDLRVKRWLCD